MRGGKLVTLTGCARTPVQERAAAPSRLPSAARRPTLRGWNMRRLHDREGNEDGARDAHGVGQEASPAQSVCRKRRLAGAEEADDWREHLGRGRLGGRWHGDAV